MCFYSRLRIAAFSHRARAPVVRPNFAGHPQAEYDRLDGVVSSSVGYTGGTAANPTYKTVCKGDGHTEAVRLVFDPKVLSYEELIRRVLSEASSHKSKAQYMSAVWAQDEQQAAAAKRAASELRKSGVPILEAKQTEWYEAEEYHQKYVAKSKGSGTCGLAATISKFGSL